MAVKAVQDQTITRPQNVAQIFLAIAFKWVKVSFDRGMVDEKLEETINRLGEALVLVDYVTACDIMEYEMANSVRKMIGVPTIVKMVKELEPLRIPSRTMGLDDKIAELRSLMDSMKHAPKETGSPPVPNL